MEPTVDYLATILAIGLSALVTFVGLMLIPRYRRWWQARLTHQATPWICAVVISLTFSQLVADVFFETDQYDYPGTTVQVLGGILVFCTLYFWSALLIKKALLPTLLTILFALLLTGYIHYFYHSLRFFEGAVKHVLNKPTN